MYRIIVVSDTHRHLEHITRVLDNIIDFDMIIHLGDNVADAKSLERLYPDKKLVAVQGNTDMPTPYAPVEIFREIEGVPILITHGHLFGVKTDTNRIFYRGKELGAEVVLFGHTHIPLCQKEEGIYLLNPGGYNSYSRSIGIIEIENSRARCCLYPC